MEAIDVAESAGTISGNGRSVLGGGVTLGGDDPSCIEVAGVPGREVLFGVASRDGLLHKSFSTQMASNPEHINSVFEGFAYHSRVYKRRHPVRNLLRRSREESILHRYPQHLFHRRSHKVRLRLEIGRECTSIACINRTFEDCFDVHTQHGQHQGGGGRGGDDDMM
jgi:hypothetical protein